MGLDRANNGASNGGHNGYRRDYHRNYRQQDQGNYSGYGNGGGAVKHEGNSKYDNNGGKYDNGANIKQDGGRSENQGKNVVAANGNQRNGALEDQENSTHQSTTTSSTSVASLETKVSTVQQDLTTALQEVTTKENEKFDLIFSILVELQRRQAQLEESVRSLKVHYSANGMDQKSDQQGQQLQTAPQPQQGQQISYMAQQMPMGQNFGSMTTADGSQAYFTPVVMAPQNGAPQMQFVMPQMGMMSAAGPMQQMPQQMAMQFVSQDPQIAVGDQYQWGAGDDSIAGTTNGQPAEAMPSGGADEQEVAEQAFKEE